MAEEQRQISEDNSLSADVLLAAWEIDGPIVKGWRAWPQARKNVATEQLRLRKAGLYKGEIDGYAGPQTRQARLRVGPTGVVAPPTLIIPPKKAPPPPPAPAKDKWPLQSECDEFYGNPRGAGDRVSASWYGANVVHVECPWVLDMDGLKLRNIEIHRKAANSLARVLAAIWHSAGSQEQIERLHYHKYSGSFNYRAKRGGSTLSMHGYAVAIDWDSEENAQHSQTHLFNDQSLLVVKFKEEGWVWGGDWSAGSIDAMHVQAARVK